MSSSHCTNFYKSLIWFQTSSHVWCISNQSCLMHFRSLAADPYDRYVAIGSAGLCGVPSLHLLDLHTGIPSLELGHTLKRGAGMLDLAWETESTFLSCGYDSCTRLWDTRVGSCVRYESSLKWSISWVVALDELLRAKTSFIWFNWIYSGGSNTEQVRNSDGP